MRRSPALLPRALACALCLALWSMPGRAEDLLSSQMVDEARMWQSKGRMDLASDTWRRLLITNPQHGEALVSLARIQLQSGQLAQAQALLARAARLAKKPAAYAQVAAALQAAQSRADAAPAGTTDVPARAAAASPPTAPVAPPVAAQPTRPPPKAVAAPNSPPPAEPRPPAQVRSAGGPAPAKPASTQRPAPAPVPPPSTEVQVTPIPFRTVEARETPAPDAQEQRSDGMQLRSSSQLLLGGAASPGAPTPARTSDTAAKTSPKNKPRPYRPAPALSPPLSE
ncbi:MAG: tetratricopeptide repeat protein [Rhodoferax sp.]